MSKDNGLAVLGLAVGLIGLGAQLAAPRCPSCGTKLIIIKNYCINCRVSWGKL